MAPQTGDDVAAASIGPTSRRPGAHRLIRTTRWAPLRSIVVSTAAANPGPNEVSRAFHADDTAAQLLGLEIIASAAGSATVAMTVRPDMANGLGVCHGGFLFTLADTAMAHASNAGNEQSLATNATIDFLAPASVGSRLVATATQQAKPNRNAVHDVTVRSDDGTLVAVFRGRTLTVGGPVLQPETT